MYSAPTKSNVINYSSEASRSKKLNTAKLVREMNFGTTEDKTMVIKEFANSKAATIFLCGQKALKKK